jgi:putative transposase
MPEYRRAFVPGGMFFFTVVTHGRRRFLCEERARFCLRRCFRDVQARRPFEIVAIVLLPDHLHCLWQLPDGDADFSTRWGLIKKALTQNWIALGGPEAPTSEARARRSDRGVWQRRFWEHTIRDEGDYQRHMDYIHYNPVKHGLVICPHRWPYSSLRRWVRFRVYADDWQCACGTGRQPAPDFSDLDETAME